MLYYKCINQTRRDNKMENINLSVLGLQFVPVSFALIGFLFKFNMLDLAYLLLVLIIFTKCFNKLNYKKLNQ